jgi:nitrous oxidase accessory protein NosD
MLTRYAVLFVVLLIVVVWGVRAGTAPSPPEQPETRAGCGSIEQRLEAAAAGAVVDLPDGCVYREAVAVGKPVTLKGGPGAEIRGSDAWTGWARRGDGLYVSDLAVPDFGQANLVCEDGTDRCKSKEQVFFDDRPLLQVSGTPAAGQFSLDWGRHVLLKDDPNAAGKVEVTTRESWISGRANNVTIDDIAFRHAANDRGEAGVQFGGDGWTLKNSDLAYAHAVNVDIARVSGSLVEGNKISNAGQLGIAGNHARGTIRGNEIFDNNTEATKAGWAGGGVKIANPEDITMEYNDVHHNRDNGLWTDVPTEPMKAVIRNNRVHHNPGDGIRIEVTKNADVYGNVVYENGWGGTGDAGIAINASSDSDVHDNVLAWNNAGITVRNPLRTDVHPDEAEFDKVVNVRVHDNDLLFEDKPGMAGRFALGWIEAQAGGGNIYDPASNNRGYDNRYYAPQAEGSVDRYRWSSQYAKLSSFNATPGEERGRYLSDAQKEQLVAYKGIPASPEPH